MSWLRDDRGKWLPVRPAADDTPGWSERAAWAVRAMPSGVLRTLSDLSRWALVKTRVVVWIAVVAGVLSLECSQLGASVFYALLAFAAARLGPVLDRLGWLDDPTAHCLRQLRAGRCPACAYRLAGLAPRDDGLTVCPECHGEWVRPAGNSRDHPPRASLYPRARGGDSPCRRCGMIEASGTR